MLTSKPKRLRIPPTHIPPKHNRKTMLAAFSAGDLIPITVRDTDMDDRRPTVATMAATMVATMAATTTIVDTADTATSGL